MSRRVLLVAVVVIVAAGALLRFSSQEEAPVIAAPGAPSPTAVAPPRPEPGPAEPVAEVEDAGVTLGVLTIAVERDGKPEVGPRLVLRNESGEEASRTTDVMGTASFELTLGEWLVMSPEELVGERVEVTEEPRRVTLSIPSSRRVEGTVLDERGAPAADVPVSLVMPQSSTGPSPYSLSALGESPAPFPVLHLDFDVDGPNVKPVARSDAAGQFAFETREEAVVIVATRGEAQGWRELKAPAHGVLVRLEELAWLTLVPPSRTQAIVSLSFGERRVVRQLEGPQRVRVRPGELDVRALMVERGKLLRASHRVLVKSGEKNELTLSFDEAPPVAGRVVDARGLPLEGVTVGLALAPSNPGLLPRAQEQVVTDARGRFELVPKLIRGGDPLYEVHLLPPWKEKRVVQVRLGDAPVTVEANEQG